MLSEELKKLIDASLTDGVLTDKERAVIRKKALLEGVDPDEVDILLDSEVQKIRQKQQEAVGNVRKCPNCGEIIPAMTSACPSCGYQLEMESNKVIERFSKGLEGKKGRSSKLFDLSLNNERANYINNFVIPNSAEELFEFTLFMKSAGRGAQTYEETEAYKSKMHECIEKIEVMFPNDPKFKALLEKTKQNWWQRKDQSTQSLIIAGSIILFILIAIICVLAICL
jgi:ribosomal protein L32